MNEFIFRCQKIALVSLRKRANSGRLNKDFFALSLDDLAYDCIADLFTRNDAGRMLQINAYFESIPVEQSSEEELLSHFRQLVFSRVNQGLFRFYNEVDPALGKILRNIKLAVQTVQNFQLTDRFGETCLVPVLCDDLRHLPRMERGELEREFRAVASGMENIPSLLAKLSRSLREQTDYSRIIPLITIAFIFRALYCEHIGGDIVYPDIDGQLMLNDAIGIMKTVCETLKKENEPQYVGKKKVNPEDFEIYFEIIGQHLECKLATNDGEDVSLFDRMKMVYPGLTKEEYYKRHRAKVEYLYSLTQKRVMKELRKNY
ncbi:MAG: hypothetical protein ACHQQQ_02005 [Bacteroidota bacterium]